MNTFYICHCGNTEDHHNFRHPFEKKTKVVRKISSTGYEKFILNADKFPLYTEIKCSFPQCCIPQNLHETLYAGDDTIIPHKFSPVEKTYREIRLVLPEDAMCHKCQLGEDIKVERSDRDEEPASRDITPSKCTLKNHRKIMTHHFTTKVIVRNKNKGDKVIITDPEDEDIKVIYK